VPKRIRVFAGDCIATFEDGTAGGGSRDRAQRGRVVVLVKPDDTVLVHDADGYQPVAWLTRPDSVTVEADDDGFTITARADERRLRVRSVDATDRRTLPASRAGIPVGDCPDCGGPLVRAGGAVRCVGCRERYGLPAGASVTDEPCPDCGLPRLRVERGEPIDVCLDPACEPLADRVRDVLDGAVDCPDCGAPLRVREATGRTFLGCERYPDCEASFPVPAGRIVDDCGCGLPVFETASGRRCLDPACDRAGPTTDGGRPLPGIADGRYATGDCPRSARRRER
jgi:DNA topoisomerase-1